KVKNGVPQLDHLRQYYFQKSKEYAAASIKAQQIFWSKQAQLDREATDKRNVHDLDSFARLGRLFIEEYDLNLKEAYRQLGYTPAPPPKKAVYQVRVVSTGWLNVDVYVAESVNNRTTLNYTDTATGKQAVIRYLPVSFQVDGAAEYDRLYVYLLPDRLSSFMRIGGSNGAFSGKLNELLKYDLVCIGYKGETTFFYSQENVVSKDYVHIGLHTASDEDWSKLRKKAVAEDLQREAAFFLFDIRDRQRQKKNQALQELRNKVMYAIYRCTLITHVY
ncbi:MAG TPA: hypothetical protein VI233_14225, partial [Puia sp.]